MFNSKFDLSQSYPLINLDLSYTDLHSLNRRHLAVLKNINYINFRRSKLKRISKEGLKSFHELDTIDLREIPATKFDMDIYRGLTKLTSVLASEHRLCCFPAELVLARCNTDRDLVSSCFDLLHNSAHRVVLLVYGCIGFCANLATFYTRRRYRETNKNPSFTILMNNLSIAYIFGAFYCLAIFFSDNYFQGEFFSYEDSWTDSLVCNLSGFLSLSSLIVSSLLILTILLGRLFSIEESLHWLRISRTSTHLLCLLSWIFGLATSAMVIVVHNIDSHKLSALCLPLDTNNKALIICFASICLTISILILAVFYNLFSQVAKLDEDNLDFHKDISVELQLSRQVLVVSLVQCVVLALVCLGYVIPVLKEAYMQVTVFTLVFVLCLPGAVCPCVYMISQSTERSREMTERKVIDMLKARGQRIRNA